MRSLFKKEILPHPDFYISKFTKNSMVPYLLFIHGGPGFNCGTIEYLIEHANLFNLLNYNIIFYDQRNCGRSKHYAGEVLHQDNVNDLQAIISYLPGLEINICGLIGHSYGAKILFDYYTKYPSNVPGVFVSTATSILTPRLNNLILDLGYLKKSNPEKYNETLREMDNLDLNKVCELSEKLNPLFNVNSDRPFLYWANMDALRQHRTAQEEINLPVNNTTFVSVRKDLYSDSSNFSVEINDLTSPYLWVNGFQDYIMNGAEAALSGTKKATVFYKSSHYPHLEENDRFCELVNGFIKNL